MYIYLTNCLIGPALLILMLCDTYLSLALFRAIIGQIPAIAHSRFGQGIIRLTDAFPHAVCRMLKLPANGPVWLPWLIITVTIMLLRNLITSYFVGMFFNR